MDEVVVCNAHAIYLLIRDTPDDERIERLKFHVDEGDYFPYLATVIGLLKDAAIGEGDIPEAYLPLIEDMKKDLIHLQEHYDLVKKDVPVPYSRRKMVRFEA